MIRIVVLTLVVVAPQVLTAEELPKAQYAYSLACDRDNLTGRGVDREGTLVVHVMAFDGEALPGVTVKVGRQSKAEAERETDSSGRVVFSALKAGAYTVEAEMRAFHRGRADAVAVHRSCTAAVSFPLPVIDLRDQ
jgi:hypothetical protein